MSLLVLKELWVDTSDFFFFNYWVWEENDFEYPNTSCSFKLAYLMQKADAKWFPRTFLWLSELYHLKCHSLSGSYRSCCPLFRWSTNLPGACLLNLSPSLLVFTLPCPSLGPSKEEWEKHTHLSSQSGSQGSGMLNSGDIFLFGLWNHWRADSWSRVCSLQGADEG